LNTKYFHRVIKWRRTKNMIKGLVIDNEWCEEPEKVKEEIKNIFRIRFSDDSNVNVRLDNIGFPLINSEDNNLLISRFSKEEIWEAIWDCDSSKSPGPDGFNFNFIKQAWDIIKMDILRAVNCFHSCGNWPTGSNASFISLIPKTENPQQLEEYRPISLIGCIYKIISKILAKRLQKVIHKIIDQK